MPNYRRYAGGSLVSNTGTWMGRVGQDWLVLTQLTDHSATALGTVTGLQFAPFLLLAPWSGALADRYPKRVIMLVTQAVMMAAALVLGVLTVGGWVRLWEVDVAAAVTGIAAAIDAPARQSFVSEIVDAELVSNAVALNSASFNSGRIVGPAVAGLVIARWDTGVAMLLNAASFLVVIAALLALDRSALHPAPTSRGRGGILEGVRYVRGRRDLQRVLLLVFVLGTFGMNFQITTALMASVEFHQGPKEFGLLGSVMAVGSLAAALLSARRPRARTRTFLLALVGFVASSGLAALAPTYPLFALALLPVGLSALTAMTTANALVQLGTEPGMRGRVMALYMAIFFGGTPVGAPLIGWLGDLAGPRWTIGVGSLAVALALAGVAEQLRRHDRMRVSLDVRTRPVVRVEFGLPEEAR
ncbi:MAG TPA: MFS transporter [Dermatophilaceae bacterium]|nr:MFS transporter [Dermatophilaceae bacterium]